MHANNETGVIQPILEIGRIARAAGVVVPRPTFPAPSMNQSMLRG